MKISSFEMLNSREVKKLIKEINEIFEISLEESDDLQKSFNFFISSIKKIYILNKFEFNVDLNDLNVNRIGIYFLNRSDNYIRLSVEGSQIIGSKAKKGIVRLSDESFKKWILGEDLVISEKEFLKITETCNIYKNPYVIIQNTNDFFGSGKVIKNKIINYLPKERRVNAIFDR